MTGDYARIRGLRRRVAALLYSTPAGERFAVAGGAALEALGLTDRETYDLDAFSRTSAPIADAARQLADAARADGLAVTHHEPRPGPDGTVSFVRLVIAAPDGTEMKVELAHDPSVPEDASALRVTDLGPTIPPHVAVGNKVCALDARRAPRDYVDVWNARHTFSPGEMLRLARAVDPDFDPRMFADALDALDRIADGEIPTGQTASLREWAGRFAADIRDGDLPARQPTALTAPPPPAPRDAPGPQPPTRCEAWMPIARTYCRRRKGHRGPHRSR